MEKHYRIVAIVQVHNEVRRGNLSRFFSNLMPLVDEIIAYDDGSTDGSWEIICKHASYPIRGVGNTFTNERSVRERLLHEALQKRADFVLWLDADEVLDARAATNLQQACTYCIDKNADGVALHEINLWKSTHWKRTDNQYNDGWFVRLWRVTPKLQFTARGSGLHQQLYPESIRKVVRFDALAVIHFGFSTVENILYKYLNYQRHGQTGWELRRLIDESTLSLEVVDTQLLSKNVVSNDPRPHAQSLQWWLQQAERQKPTLLQPKLSIVALIYQSTAWAKFCYDQVLKNTNMHDVEFFFVANDATEGVKNFLQRTHIPHYIFENTAAHKKEWYINNVYRAWNFGAEKAHGEYVLFVNSDMAFTPGWADRLLSDISPTTCVASRLVESGKMPSGVHGIEKNFGQNLNTFNEQAFLRFAKKHSSPKMHAGGLFMPLLIQKEHFLSVGGYPEGNVKPGSDPFKPTIAAQGEPIVSGDVILMEKLKAKGIQHVTDFSVLAYHFQEGEMDDSATTSTKEKNFTIVCNDWLTGRMGEKTMWNELVERLPGTTGIDHQLLGDGNIAHLATKWIRRQAPEAQVVIQNASFMDSVQTQGVRIVYLQDDLRRMGSPSQQQEENLRNAHFRVTNSLLTAESYPEYNFSIIPIGVNEHLFQPMSKETIRRELNLPQGPLAIFVGDLSEVKGWAKVQNIIETQPDIHWIVVSKSAETFLHERVRMFNKVDQPLLAKLYNAADVFVIGSPVETQCLAAIEAGLCNVPIAMPCTGIFWEMPEEIRNRIGMFENDLEASLRKVLKTPEKFTPRQTLLDYGVTIPIMVERWEKLLQTAHQLARQHIAMRAATPYGKRAVLLLQRTTTLVAHGVVWTLKKIAKSILPHSWAVTLAKFLFDKKS